MNGPSVQIDLGDCLLQNVGGMPQVSLLLFVEFEAKHLPHATAIKDRGKAQADAVNSVVIVNQAGNLKYRVLMTKNGFSDSHEPGGDSIVSCAFALDDTVGSVPRSFKDLLHGRLVAGNSMKAAIIGESHAGNIRERPDGNLAVSVLTNDEGVNAACIHTEVLAEQKAKARSIKDCSRADHSRPG